MVRRIHCSLALAIAATLFVNDATAVEPQSWVVSAAIRSGNTALVSSPNPPAPAAPVDSTGFLEANGSDLSPPAQIDAGAVAEFGLTAGTMAVSSGFDAIANFPDDLRIFAPVAGASATYVDDLTITSSSLSSGTPVTVRFVYALSFTSGASSSEDMAVVSADVTSTVAGVQGIAPAANRYFDDLDSGSFIANGLFSGAQMAQFDVQSTVGATISFALVLDGASSGSVRVTGSPGNEVNQQADGWMSVGVSFGGEVVGADAQIQSGILSGPFPSASAVSSAAADAALPFNPFEVPAPGATATAVSALGSLLFLASARRSRRSS